MASNPALLPSSAFREGLIQRGGDTAYRCYQCATCSSVCELAPAGAPFPRRQMLTAQWGLADSLAGDPAVWLCHQCNDCTVRCPRDAKPGHVMHTVRSLVVEHLAFPSFIGKLVANARTTWPLLIGLPILIWVVLLGLYNQFTFPAIDAQRPFIEGRFMFEEFVPHILIYLVFFPTAAWAVLAAFNSGRRFWALLGADTKPRSGSLLGHLIPAIIEIGTHRRFATCAANPQRRWGHFGIMWGFIGAFITTSLAVVYLYGFDAYPFPLTHWVKWLGNISALALVGGGMILLVNRFRADPRVGATTAFDRFFLAVVLAVIFSGVLTELGRFALSPALACIIYVLHLGTILCLFFTFPYSKFAHLMYRTLAMVHELMTREAADKA